MNELDFLKSKKSDEIWLLSYADLITNLLIFFVAILSVAQIDRVKLQQVQEKLSGQRQEGSLSEIHDEITNHIKKEGLTDVVSAELTSRGVEISLNSGVIFPLGSAEINREWRSILDRVIQQLVPYSQKYSFAIEGHTDDTPIKGQSQYESNWELASARAHQVRKNLETAGIAHRRIHTESYADTRPLDDKKLENMTEDEVRSRHRRVVIRVY